MTDVPPASGAPPHLLKANTATSEDMTETLREMDKEEKKVFEGEEAGSSGSANNSSSGNVTSTTETGGSATSTNGEAKKALPGQIEWGHEEVKNFWESVFPGHYNSYSMDGMHPKCLCSKICNDVLRTNININSSSQNPNDRILCFEVLANLERKFIEYGIVQEPKQKPGAPANQQVYQRVTAHDLNKLCDKLPEGPNALEAWARTIVEASIQRLSGLPMR